LYLYTSQFLNNIQQQKHFWPHSRPNLLNLSRRFIFTSYVTTTTLFTGCV
jgi:hypothetical protein